MTEIYSTLNTPLAFSSKYYKHILLKLDPNQTRLIGGCVRDALQGKMNADIDIATALLPTQVIDILSQAKIKVIPTGIKFGTVTAIFKGEKFEITTLRKDIDCDGRHAKVAFTDNFAEDAARRDFTINALSYCPFKNEIYDYFSGLEDLQHQRVIFIGNPIDRIQEDYLRILRFFRFSSFYAKTIDTHGITACEKLKEGLNALSNERIKQEMDKLIISTNAPSILRQMFDSGILQILFPIDYYNEDWLKQTNDNKLNIYTKYALLLGNTKVTELLKMKFSRQEAIKIYSISDFINQVITASTMKKLWFEKIDYTEYLFAAAIVQKITLSVAKQFINKYSTISRPVFPINGYDLLKLGINNKDIGLTLDKLKSLWIESDFMLTKQELMLALPL